MWRDEHGVTWDYSYGCTIPRASCSSAGLVWQLTVLSACHHRSQLLDRITSYKVLLGVLQTSELIYNVSWDVTSTYNTDCVTKSLLTANWQVCISVPNREFLLPAFGKKAIYLSPSCIIFHRTEKQLSSFLESAESNRLTSAIIIIFIYFAMVL